MHGTQNTEPLYSLHFKKQAKTMANFDENLSVVELSERYKEFGVFKRNKVVCSPGDIIAM